MINKQTIETEIKNLYLKFSDDFRNGDIIITGSYLYEKLGLIAPREEYNDLDIAVITGKAGDEIMMKIQVHYLEQGGRTRVIYEPNQGGFVRVKNKMKIDIFRDDIQNYDGVDFELMPDIWMKDYGVEKILYDLDQHLEILLAGNPEWFADSIQKTTDTINEIKTYL